MAYETVRNLLDKMVHLHRQLRDVYGRLEERSEKEQVKLLLDYCRAHEAKLGSATAEFERNASSPLLDTWFSFTPDTGRWEELARVQIDPGATAEEAARAVVDVDEAIIAVYREILGNSETDEVRELFQHLVDVAESMRNRFVRSAREIIDA